MRTYRRRLLRSGALVPLLLAVTFAPAPAAARTTITPYLQVEQVFSADLSHGGDDVTYTGVGAGVDAQFDSSRVHGQIDYQYNHYFAWSKRYSDTDLHNGLARVDYELAPGLSLDAAAIATRTRTSFARSSPGLLIGDFDNTSQVYGFNGGPVYHGHAGDLNIDAGYHFDYVKATDGGRGDDLGPGLPVLPTNFATMSHVADAAIGERPGVALPFGWTVSGGFVDDEIHFLDARYTSKWGRLDVAQPVSPTLELLAGAGYQADRAGQSALLTDAAGNAILTDRRHLRADHDKPRVLSYDESGLVWDVGVLWRPSSRTTLRVRGGQRYGQTVITGDFEHQLSASASIQVVAYDDITSFGRQLGDGIGALPTSFASPLNAVPVTLAGCVFGSDGGAGACLPGLVSVNSNFYRSRGVYGTISVTRGNWTWGLGVNYDNRRYFAPRDGTAAATFANVTDESVTVDGVVTRRLSEVSSASATVYAAWYRSEITDNRSFSNYGATGSYYRNFTRRLSGDASLGIYSGSGGNVDEDVIGTAQVGLRYVL